MLIYFASSEVTLNLCPGGSFPKRNHFSILFFVQRLCSMCFFQSIICHNRVIGLYNKKDVLRAQLKGWMCGCEAPQGWETSPFRK